MMYRTGNPALQPKRFERDWGEYDRENTMTLNGTVEKIILLFIVTLGTAAAVWTFLAKNLFTQTAQTGMAGMLVLVILIGGGILSLITAMVTIFVPRLSPTTAPLYCLFEGALIGAVSLFMEQSYPGIVMQAVLITFGVAFGTFLIYRARLIPVTQNFRIMVFAGTIGIGFAYLVTFLLRMFVPIFAARLPFMHNMGGFTGGYSSLLSIGLSLFVVMMAALNLVMDFDYIENASEMGLPKYMEWYGAFGLMVTLIWLYFEILRLLSKLRSR